jgi:hypothetical protein
MHWFLTFIFGIKLYVLRTVPLSITRSFSLCTQQLYMSYRFADSLQAGSGRNCSQAVSKPVWHTQLLCVQWKPPDDGQRNCPKHVAVSKPVWHITFLCVQWKPPDDGQRNCPKHVGVSKPVWHITLLCVQWKTSWWWTEELFETCSCQQTSMT